MKAEQFTKRKISDITVFTNDLDEEYKKRILSAKSIKDIRSILIDFEEFLPSGLQKFRECDDESSNELVKQIIRYQHRVKNKQKLPMDPTESTMFIVPPLITIPRMLSLTMSQDEKRFVTWGEAFLKLNMEGHIDKIRYSQENMYKHIIDAKEKVKDAIDTTSKNAPVVDGGDAETEKWPV